MPVAFFLPSFEIGGAERNTQHLLRFLSGKNYQLSLVLAEKKGSLLAEVPQSVNVIDLHAKGYISIFFALKKYLHTEKPETLISAFPHFNILALLAKKFSGASVKIILTEHTPYSLLPATSRNFFNKLISIFILPPLMKWLYPSAASIICVSAGVAEDLKKMIPAAAQKITVIYNPIVDDSMIKLAEEKVSHTWFSEQIPVLIAVGRLAKAKDYPVMFKALKIVLEKKPVRLLILGGGPEEKNLKARVSEMGLGEHVQFLGFQENPYVYMKQSSVFVLSSMQEGFGNAMVEAMACGLPVVATDCHSGPGEIVEHGKNGLLVPVKNPQQFAQAILEVLENPELAQQLREGGLLRAQDFSVEKSAKMYERVL